MNISQIEKTRGLVKRSLRLSAIALLIAASTFINIAKHSNIRTVEVISILAIGIAIGGVIFNLALLSKLNKMKGDL